MSGTGTTDPATVPGGTHRTRKLSGLGLYGGRGITWFRLGGQTKRRVCEARAADAHRRASNIADIFHRWNAPRYRTKGLLINSIRLGIELRPDTAFLPSVFLFFLFFFSSTSLSQSSSLLLLSVLFPPTEPYRVQLLVKSRGNPNVRFTTARSLHSLRLIYDPRAANTEKEKNTEEKNRKEKKRSNPLEHAPALNARAFGSNRGALAGRLGIQCVPVARGCVSRWGKRGKGERRAGKKREIGGRRRRLQRRGSCLFPQPTFYFICFAAAARRQEGEARRNGDEGEERHFSQSRVLSTVISTKIRQRLAHCPRACAATHAGPNIAAIFSPSR